MKYIAESQKRLEENQNQFYTVSNTHVYLKDNFVSPENVKIDIRSVLAKVEKKIPAHLLSYIEYIFVGWFDEFDERKINSFYKDGTIYISNFQDNEIDMIDDIIHEIAHSLEIPHGQEIYGDGKIEQEFIAKRKRLFYLLQADGYDIRLNDFLNTEYDENFDQFLLQTVGYDKLSNYLAGLMINPYAATSIREYFASAFEEFYMEDQPAHLQKISPSLFKKINNLHMGFLLDR
tara:strand:+ start:38148 stop:38846 length:699 start_codon:yes stop_codon:yes gene_type:complete